MASSLAAKRSCASTTPFGTPVEPDVKMTSAAPSSSGRGGGAGRPVGRTGAAASASRTSRAPVASISASTDAATLDRCTGTATAPTRQTASSAATSSGWLETMTGIGSAGAAPAERSAAASVLGAFAERRVRPLSPLAAQRGRRAVARDGRVEQRGEIHRMGEKSVGRTSLFSCDTSSGTTLAR